MYKSMGLEIAQPHNCDKDFTEGGITFTDINMYSTRILIAPPEMSAK